MYVCMYVCLDKLLPQDILVRFSAKVDVEALEITSLHVCMYICMFGQVGTTRYFG